MFPKEMPDGIVTNCVYSLFIEYVDEIELSKNYFRRDENRNRHIGEAAECLWKANKIREKIEKIMGLRKHLLEGLFVYLDTLDVYFNPKLNSKEEFFSKIFTYNFDLLEKIGKKVVKPYFPFTNVDNYKKKIVLIR